MTISESDLKATKDLLSSVSAQLANVEAQMTAQANAKPQPPPGFIEGIKNLVSPYGYDVVSLTVAPATVQAVRRHFRSTHSADVKLGNIVSFLATNPKASLDSIAAATGYTVSEVTTIVHAANLKVNGLKGTLYAGLSSEAKAEIKTLDDLWPTQKRGADRRVEVQGLMDKYKVSDYVIYAYLRELRAKREFGTSNQNNA